ncbi:DUF1648 domain-containing protein [Chryseobacterium lathyri]|jgi:hypothetical protein|uniref:DUF1648 domain-containing protein n=1 Tax=Chryseobacterium lathyri TaxID=395933 RepID=A0A511YD45_9FLAO|nr:DUF1648 domain-containing protein [Chryseobacterium lathyri]GEN73083.1 hypothetical protein CLA01_31550 [Chryseobacterium lathyri]
MIPKHIKLLFCIPFIIIIVYTVYLLTKYSSIPDVIPIHGYGGKNDGFGSKLFLFAPIVFNLVILIFIWMAIRKPDKIRFTFEVKEEDKEKTYYQYQLVLIILAIFVTLIMCPLSFSDVVFK